MATPQQLVESDVLIDLREALDPDELAVRRLYAFPKFDDWYNEQLPKIKPWKHGGGRLDPMDQVDDLIYRFLMGEPFDVEWKSRNLAPHPDGIWELKTTDIRLFGWFWRQDTYIISSPADANWTKKIGTYEGYFNETMYRRTHLNLDDPKFISGGYTDVFQV